MSSRQFQVKGSALIEKVHISAAARKSLQGITITVDDKSLQGALKPLNTQLNTLASTLSKTGTTGLGRITTQMQSIGSSTAQANTKLKEQELLITQVLRKASAFRIAAIFINSFVNSITNSFNALLKFDSSLRDINKIARISDKELGNLGIQIIELAGNYNIAASEALDAYKVITQLGLGGGAKDILIYNEALKIAATSTLNLQDSISLLVSVAQQSGLTFEEAANQIGRLSAIEDASAVDLKDLAEINTKAGTSIAQSFRDATKAASLFAAVQERTKAGGATVGTFAKTFIARLSGSNSETTKGLKELNISLTDTAGKLKDPIDLLLELKKGLTGLNEEDVGDILGKVFGVRQIELGKATLDVLGDATLKNGRAFDIAASASLNYTSKLFKIQEESKKFEAQLTKIKNGLLSFFAAAANDTVGPLLQKLIDLSGTLKNVLSTLGIKDAFKGLLVGGTAAAGGFILKNILDIKTRKQKDKLQLQNLISSGMSPQEAQNSMLSQSRNDIRSRVFGNNSNVFSASSRPRRALVTGVDRLITGATKIDPFNATLDRVRGSLGGRVQPNGLRGNSQERRFIDMGEGRNSIANRFGVSRESVGPRADKKGLQLGPSLVGGNKTPGNLRAIFAGNVKELGKFKTLLHSVGAGFVKLDKALSPFSAEAAVAGTALAIFGASLTEASKESTGLTSELQKVAGSALTVSGGFMIFGGKMALAAGAMSLAYNLIKKMQLGIEAKNGNLEAQAQVLEMAGDVEGAKGIRGRAFSKKVLAQSYRGSLDEEVTQFRDNVVTAFNDIAKSVGNIEDPEIRKKEAAARINAFISGLEIIKPGSKEALLGKFENGRRISTQQGLLASGSEFAGKLENKNFAKLLSEFTVMKFDESVIQNINAAAEALSILSPAEIALFETRQKIKVLADEEIDALIEESKLKQTLVESTLSLTGAQRALFNAQQDFGGLDALKQELKLKEQLREVSLSSLRENIILEQQRQTAVRDAKALELQAEIQKKKIVFENLTGGQPFQSDISKVSGGSVEARNEIQSVIRDVLSLEDERKAFLNSEIKERKKFQELQTKLNTAENNAAAEKYADLLKLSEAEKQFNKERLANIQAMRTEFLGFKDAGGDLFSFLRNDNPTQKLDVEISQREEANKLRMDSLKSEISLLRELADQGRRNEIAFLRYDLTGKLSPDPRAPNGQRLTLENPEDNIKKNRLDTLLSGPLKDGEEIKKKLLEVFNLQISIGKQAIEDLQKRLELEKTVNREKLSAGAALIDQARELKSSVSSIFNAQKSLTDAIRSKIDESVQNIRSKRSDLSSAMDGLRSAREGLNQSINSARDSSIEYSMALARANIQADKVLGTFYGFKDQAASLNTAFQSLISSAQSAGASELQLSKIRTEAVKEQLAAYTSLLDEQRSKSQNYFTSSADDRLGFVQGLSALQNILSQFGGNVDNFRGLNQNQLNTFGQQLLSIPQELRQKISASLDQLPNGVGVAGFTSDQIKEVLQGGALGSSSELGIDPLSENIKIVADLTRQSVEMDKSSLIAAQLEANNSVAAVENAKEQVLIAKIMLSQAKQDAIGIQSAIKEVTDRINSSIFEYKDSIRAQTLEIINSDRTAVQKQQALGELTLKVQSVIADKINAAATSVGAIAAGFTIGDSTGPQPTGGKAGFEMLDSIFKESTKNLANFTEKVDGFVIDNKALIKNVGDAASSLKSLGDRLIELSVQKLDEIKVTILNEQKVNITGATEAVQEIMDAINKRGFITQQDIDGIQTTLDRLIARLISAGTIPASEGLRR